MRARRASLTRSTVVAGALALIDREGLGALTMRRLGRELGVEAMSLYNHVRDKEDLLDAIVGLLASEVSLPGEEAGSWADRMAELMRRYRGMGRRHPNALPLIALRPLRTPEALEPYLEALELASAAIGPYAARTMARVLASYANGFVLNEVAAAFTLPGDLDADFEHGVRVIVEGFERREDG